MKKLLLVLLLATPSFAQYRIPASLLGFHWIPLQITQPGGSSGSGLPAGCSAPDANTISCPTLGTSGSNGGIDFTEGTGAGLTAATSHCIWWGDSTTHTPKFNCNNGTTYIPVQATSSVTISGPTAARIYTGPDAAATLATGAGTNNLIPKYTTGASAILGNSSITDDGTTVTSTDTGGMKAPTFISTGTTAGFVALPQGTTSAAVAPCNAANVICDQAPVAVTAQLRTRAGTPATGFDFWTNTAGSMVETLIGSTGTGNVALATSPVLVTPSVTVINDANAAAFIQSSATASAVDGVTITTAATANPATVTIAASGSDSNVNTTIGAKGTGIVKMGTFEQATSNTVALTADWTCGTGGTVSSCTAAVIVGSTAVPLTFTFPLQALSWSFQCDLVVGQATAATANQWNLLTATNGATNVTAYYQMGTAATATANGAVTDQAATTTTFQIAPSWTLGGTATKMPVRIWGRVESTSASGTVLSLQLLAPTVADLVTIYRGSSCRVF